MLAQIKEMLTTGIVRCGVWSFNGMNTAGGGQSNGNVEKCKARRKLFAHAENFAFIMGKTLRRSCGYDN